MLILSVIFIYTMNYVKTDSFSCILWWFTEEEENLLLSVVIICFIAITKSHDRIAGLHSDRNCANPEQKAVFFPKGNWEQMKTSSWGRRRRQYWSAGQTLVSAQWQVNHCHAFLYNLQKQRKGEKWDHIVHSDQELMLVMKGATADSHLNN